MATKIRDYGKLAADICEAVGKDNIIRAAHCATRLRLVLKETPSAEVTQRISEMPAVFAPFVYILAAAGLVQGALIISFFNTKYYVYAGLPGLLTTVNAMSNANPSSFTGMMIGVLATIIVTILLVQVVGCDEKESAKK